MSFIPNAPIIVQASFYGMGVVFEGFRVVVANRAEDGAHPFRGVGEENSDQLADNIAIDFVLEFQKLAQYSWVDWLLCGRVLRLVPRDGIFVALVEHSFDFIVQNIDRDGF